MEGMGGGPNPAGMRNVIVREEKYIVSCVVDADVPGILSNFVCAGCCCSFMTQNLDRTDAGHSPLWNLMWATAMPINYSADQFSNSNQGTVDNGFEFFKTPVYVNCPDIGLVGEEMNPLKADSFETDIVLGNLTSYALIGTSPDLIFQADQTISFVAVPSNTTVGESTTNIMGGYEYAMPAVDIPDGTTQIDVMYDGVSIRTIPVETNDDEDISSGSNNNSMSSASSSTMLLLSFVPGFVVSMVAIVTTTTMLVVY
jgi:hypothetical protein